VSWFVGIGAGVEWIAVLRVLRMMRVFQVLKVGRLVIEVQVCDNQIDLAITVGFEMNFEVIFYFL
jgi:hypothetical protein